LVVWYSALFTLSVLILFGLAYMLLSSSLRQRDRESIRLELDERAAQYRAGGLVGLKRSLALRERFGTAKPFLIRVAAPDNRTVLITIPDQWAEFDLSRLESAAADRQWISLPARGDENVLEVTSARLPDGSILQVGQSTEDREQVLERFREIVASVVIPVVVLGFVAGAFLASRALRPIRQIIQTVRAIQAGAMDARVPTRQTGDELDELGTLFNGMLERISALIQGMRGALDNVAHDLRTPMSRIRGAAEMALRSGGEPDTYREALADCVEESDRLLTMLNTFMDISEAEIGALRLNLEAVNISPLLDDVVDLYQYVAEEKKIALSTAAPPELWLRADRNRLRQVLANLLDNAIKYTPAGGRVEIRASQQQRAVVISVKDTGIGMPPDELPKIWDRLYRADQSRSQRGLGLGLSLVRAVVQAHGGDVEASSAIGVGSTFTIRLPRPA